MLRLLGFKRKERPVEISSKGIEGPIPVKSIFGSIKQRPKYSSHMSSSDLILKISLPISSSTITPAFVDSLPPRPASTVPPPSPNRTQPLIPRRTTSTLRNPKSHKPSPLYNLKSFSTTHINSITSIFSSSTTNLSLTDDTLHFPTPPPRRPHRPDSEIFKSSYSLFPTSAPQLAALDFNEPFSFPVLSDLMEDESEAEVDEVEKQAIPVEIEKQAQEKEVPQTQVQGSEENNLSIQLGEPIDLERRPSGYTSIPPPITRRSPKSTAQPLDADLGEGGFNWKRASIALSCSSLLDDEYDTPLSTPRLSGFGSGSSSSGSDEMECSTPKSELAELPLSPEYLPVDGKRRASLAFPSRMGASCISLGRY